MARGEYSRSAALQSAFVQMNNIAMFVACGCARNISFGIQPDTGAIACVVRTGEQELAQGLAILVLESEVIGMTKLSSEDRRCEAPVGGNSLYSYIPCDMHVGVWLFVKFVDSIAMSCLQRARNVS